MAAVISYVGAGTESGKTAGANPTPAYPSGVQLGDYLVVKCSASVSTVFATNALTGWTRLYGLQSGGASPTGAHFWKFADSTDVAASGAGSTVTVTSPGGVASARMFAYRDVDSTSPHDIAVVSDGSSSAQTNYVVPTATTVTDHTAQLLHAWSNATSGTFTPPSGYTEIWDSTTGGTTNATTVDHKLDQTPAGATGTRTIVRSAGVKGGQAGVSLRPAPTEVDVSTTAPAAHGEGDSTAPTVIGGTGASVTAPAAAGEGMVRPPTDVTGETEVDVPGGMHGVGGTVAPQPHVETARQAVPAHGEGLAATPASVTGSAKVAAPSAAGTGDTQPPSVLGIRIATILVAAAAAVGAMAVPQVSSTQVPTVQVTAAAGAGGMARPGFDSSNQHVVSGVPMEGIGAVTAPAVHAIANADLAPPPPTGDGHATAPAVSGGAHVLAAASDGEGGTAAPSVAGHSNGLVEALPGIGEGVAAEPVVFGRLQNVVQALAPHGEGDMAQHPKLPGLLEPVSGYYRFRVPYQLHREEVKR